MGESFADQYRRWFEYEQDSHRKVLDSLKSVSDATHSEAAFQRAVDLMAHIAAARRMWLFRFGVLPAGPRELFPTGHGLSEAGSELTDVQDHWTAYLARLTDTELAREFVYQSLDAGKFRSTVRDILTQLFGHSLYHRGQIAMLVRSLGGGPAVTDFVYWTRRAATESSATG